MALTARQRTFLLRLLDLARERGRPIHYTEVAERLGVARSTAYEMLRRLAEKGYAQAGYSREGRQGQGRAAVVFSPTLKSLQALRRRAAERWSDAEWEELKTRLMAAVDRLEQIEGVKREEIVRILRALASKVESLGRSIQSQS